MPGRLANLLPLLRLYHRPDGLLERAVGISYHLNAFGTFNEIRHPDSYGERRLAVDNVEARFNVLTG